MVFDAATALSRLNKQLPPGADTGSTETGLELDFTLAAGCWLYNDIGRSLPQQEEQEVPLWRYRVSLWPSNPAALSSLSRGLHALMGCSMG